MVRYQRFGDPSCFYLHGEVIGDGKKGLDLHPEDGGSMDLRNVVILSQYYTASQPRRLRLEYSPP